MEAGLRSKHLGGNFMIVAILGIGEAGGTFARDLIAEGVVVHGWDPEPRAIPDELDLASSNPAAVIGVDIVLSVNWASVSIEVATEVAQVLQPNQLFADLNTASPQNKRDVAAIIEKTGAQFIDGAIMAPVPPKGLRTPVYASGSGAELFAEKMSPLGMPITVLDREAGSAATYKLVRSIMYKGVAAVVMECLEAAETLGMSDYARLQMMTILRDESMIDRFVNGSKKHAKRRMHEMEAVVELLDSIGVSAFTSRASVEKLKEIQAVNRSAD
jgi:3-hydroxyisobutyrate dehydrogenase-like beta-hydroxyacid dehydrogenase